MLAPKLTTYQPSDASVTTTEAHTDTPYSTTTGPTGDQSSHSPLGHEGCPDCDNSELRTEGRDRYCVECGAVVSGQTIERSEPSWRDISDRRLGPGQSNQWVNTGTKTITGPNESARFFRYNDRLDNNERSMVKGLREVRSISAKLELPSTMREQAAHWYRNVVRNELLQGRSIESFAAASVYVAARERSYPITIDGLAECCPVSAQEIRHQMSILHKEFSVEIKPAKPEDFLASIISNLRVERTFEYKVRKLLESVTEDGYHIGKHPAAIAATTIYTVAAASEITLNQETVAKEAGVSTVTISRHNQEIKKFLNDVDADILGV